MAKAAGHIELKIAELLRKAERPLTAANILAALRATYNMRRAQLSDVNSTLYGTNAYATVTGSTPSQWYLRGSAAARHAVTPLMTVAHLPPPEVVPDGEFQKKAVAVAGSCGEPGQIAAALALLVEKGAGTLRCLTGHEAGKHMAAAAQTAGVAHERIAYSRDGGREEMLAAHRDAVKGDVAALIILGDPDMVLQPLHHLLAAFEILDKPVYLVPSKAPKNMGCGSC